MKDLLDTTLEVSVNESGKPIAVGLWDAENNLTQLILWLYSIEPSIANDLNETCRNMIKENLPTLGPFACALNCILYGAEQNRKDFMITGNTDHAPSNGNIHDLGFFCRSILVYRGVTMKESWIQPWRNSVGLKGMRDFHKRTIEPGFENKPAYVQIPGFFSTSENL